MTDFRSKRFIRGQSDDFSAQIEKIT